MEQEFLNFLNEPEWWISVVVAGLIINLLSSYFKTALDNQFSKISSWWRERSQARRKEREDYINRLKNEPKFSQLNQLRHANSSRWSIQWTLLGVMCFLVALASGEPAGAILMFIGSLALFRSMQHSIRASYYRTVAEEALDSEDT